jgi:UDP-N-acetylmuramate dehydrogenase
MRELSLDSHQKATFCTKHMTKLQQHIKQEFPDFSLFFDFKMAEHTYFKIGGPAEVFVELSEKEQISNLIKWCKQEGVKLTFLGGGSNIIVDDAGVEGVVIRVTNNDISLVDGRFLVGAGAKTSLFVKETVDQGYTGLEYFLGVPGSIGGAVYNNAHYLEDLIGRHVSRVEVLTEDGEFMWLDQDDCEFSYDSSRFQKTKEVIYQVEFSLEKGNKEDSMGLIKKATEYRAKTQPLGLPSSGCIFQNVPNTPELREKFPQFKDRQHVPGGFLIDQAGLKGTTEGDIEVSEKHAAFFINNGKGTADQVKKLIDRVKSTVFEKFGVELKEEVFWLK